MSRLFLLSSFVLQKGDLMDGARLCSRLATPTRSAHVSKLINKGKFDDARLQTPGPSNFRA